LTNGGTYYVTQTTLGCESAHSATVTVTINTTPYVTSQTPAAICSGGSVSLLSNGFTGTNVIPAGTTFSWSAPSVTGITGTSSGTAQTSFSTGILTNTTSIQKTVIFTLTPTATGCSGSTFTITVIVNPTPTASASSNSPVCAGQTLNLTGGASGLTSYSWTGPNSYTNGTQSPSIPNVTTLAGGTYTLKVTDDNSCTSTASTSVVVNRISLCGAYTGVYFANTGLTTTGGQATVNLIFNISGSGTCNDISNLTKDVFNVTSDAPGSVDYGTATYSGGIYTVPATIKLGNVYSTSVNFTLNIASAYTNRYELGTGCTDQPMITVSSLAGDFVTGGGYIIPPGTTTCTGTTTSLLKGAPNTTATANGLKNNFGFNIKWNKSLKNLQGNWNTIIRATDGHRYQVKSSQPSSLAITKLTSGKYRADLVYSPVNFQDLSTGLWSDGGGSSRAQVTVIDNSEPGAGVDQIFISVYDKNGNLWYSSNTCTQAKAGSEGTIAILNQGNIQIHNGAITAPGTTRDLQTLPTALIQTFDITATPNPTFSYFNLNIAGNNAAGLVNVKVTDVLGRVVEAKQNLAPGQTLRIGSEYKPGVYIVQVMQGDTVKQLKLVKQ
jgi:hypothetical protein